MQNLESAQTEKNLSQVIKIDESQIRTHLDQMVRSTVEESCLKKYLICLERLVGWLFMVYLAHKNWYNIARFHGRNLQNLAKKD